MPTDAAPRRLLRSRRHTHGGHPLLRRPRAGQGLPRRTRSAAPPQGGRLRRLHHYQSKRHRKGTDHRSTIPRGSRRSSCARRAADWIDATYYCPDAPGVPSKCRKPEPGMVLAAAAEHHIDLAASYFVGDKSLDIECGRRAGTHTVLVLTGYGSEQRCARRPHLQGCGGSGGRRYLAADDAAVCLIHSGVRISLSCRSNFQSTPSSVRSATSKPCWL